MTDDLPSICFYIRCWITRHAVQLFVQRKGKPRASVAPRDPSRNEQSVMEQPHLPLRPNSVALLGSRPAAPAARSMLPPTTTTNEQAGPDDEASSKALNTAVSQSTTTPNKRKAPTMLRQPGSGKSPKVTREAPLSDDLPRAAQRDIYSVPMSPAPVFQTLPTGLVHRGQRESTYDTDCTYAPPREATVETDDTVDYEDIMQDTEGR
jgi:hypothetical protein